MMRTPTGSRSTRVPSAAGLLARAALFGAIAQAFHYPDATQLTAIRKALDRQRRGAPSHAQAVSRALRATLAAFAAISAQELEAAYVRLFLTSVACPPHETAYGDGRRMAGRTAEMADISGFYLAFGLQPSEREADLPDHLCTELEFYSILLLKQAYALTHRWRERRRIAERAAATFMEQHLGRWVKAFADSLLEQDPPAPYRALAKLLVAAVRDECRRLGVRPRLVSGRIAGDEMQAEQFICPHEGGTLRTAAGQTAGMQPAI